MNPILEKKGFVNMEAHPRLWCPVLSSKIHPLKPSPKNKKGVCIWGYTLIKEDLNRTTFV